MPAQGGVICLATLVTMRESSASVILHRKAKRLQKETGKYDLREKSTTNRSPREQFAFAILRPLKMLIFSPIVLTLSIYTAVIYGYMYLCFTTFPIIFEQQYGFSQASSGLAYLGIGVGSFFGLALAGGLSDRTVTRLAARNPGGPKPEYRIPILTIGAFLVPAGLFWYGWSAENKEQYMVPIVGTGLLGGGIVIAVVSDENNSLHGLLLIVSIQVGTTTYLVDAFTEYSASAVAAATVLRSLLGALLPLAGPEMYSSLGVAWGNSLLAFIAVAMVSSRFIYTLTTTLPEKRLTTFHGRSQSHFCSTGLEKGSETASLPRYNSRGARGSGFRRSRVGSIYVLRKMGMEFVSGCKVLVVIQQW